MFIRESNFTVEEISDFDGNDDDLVRPDHYEDADSDHARSVKASNDLDPGVIYGFRNLDCEDEDPLATHQAWLESERAEKRRKRRSSSSVQKRKLSQSMGSDTDNEDLHPQQFEANEVGSSARRLRRKVAGESLIFDDPPPGIPELEEPESCEDAVEHDMEDAQGVDKELPYYVEDVDMDSTND